MSPGKIDPTSTPSLPPPATVTTLDGVTAGRIEEEARRRYLDTSETIVEQRRSGRVEAETHRISEEMTHQAQRRKRLHQMMRPVPEGPAIVGVPPRLRRQLDRELPQPMPVHRLLVPLLGEMYAQSVLPYASALASHLGAAITLVDVEPGEAADYASRDGPTTPHALAAMLPRNIVLDRKIASERTLVADLLALEKRDAADIVVLAMAPGRDLTMEGMALLAKSLIRGGPANVLIIPPGAGMGRARGPSFRRILVPLDGSALAEQALSSVITLANASGHRSAADTPEITLFTALAVWPKQRGAEHYLRVIEELLRSKLVQPVRISCESTMNEPSEAIISLLEGSRYVGGPGHDQFDLVVMATHGRQGFWHWLLGSVADAVLERTTIPVLFTRGMRVL